MKKSCRWRGATTQKYQKQTQNHVLQFKTTYRNQTEDQTVGGRLYILIKKIPAVKIEGEATVNITEEEWQFASELDIDYWGDQLIELPSSFADAIRVYKNLTAHTIASTKVVEFTLSPITDYCDKITSILNEISADNVDKVSKILVIQI